jgi:hypothetical protein
MLPAYSYYLGDAPAAVECVVQGAVQAELNRYGFGPNFLIEECIA